MIPFKSGRVLNEESDMKQLLIHEQLHFNITEYHARLFRKEAIGIGKEKLTNEDLQRLGKKYLEAINSMQDKYDKESKHNTEQHKQRYWELHVAGLLRETAYYANQDLYSYQEFLKETTPWYRTVYYTVEGELLTSYPEKQENKKFGEVYHVNRKQDSIVVEYYLNGKPTNGGFFEAAQCIISFPTTTTREVKLFDPEGKPFSNATEAHITHTKTDAEGNIVRTFYDGNGKQVSIKGVFTKKGVWDAAKKNMYSSYFDKDDKAVKYNGAYHELRIMGSNKVTKSISYFNKAGKPMRDKYLASIYEYKTDDNFKIRAIKMFYEDGTYALGIDGYHTVFEYDEHGNTKSEAFLDQFGNNTADTDGVHKYVYTYDLNDNCTDLRKYNIQELPTKGRNDIHQQVFLYDTLGRNTFSADYYPDYILKFSENKNGAFINEYVGDDIVNVKSVDAYGNDAVNDSGILFTKQFLTDKKEVIREEFFGPEGAWAKTEDGVVAYNYKFDERGNQIEVAAFDSLGKPKAWQEDVSITRWEFDKKNNKTKTTYFTVDNELANAVQDVTYNVFKYDGNSTMVERTNYDRNKNPCLLDGVFRTTVITNRFGKDSIVTNYDVNNKIVVGNGIIKSKYNPQGILLSESLFNEHNQPVLNEYGIHKTVYVLDKFDRYLGYTYYGKNGERINSSDGTSIIVYKLNPSGFVLNYSYYDKNEKRVLGPDGFHSLENFYNDMDDVVRISTYGTDQRLLNNAEGIADYVYTIDESGRTVRVSFFDAESNLTEDSDGVAEYFYMPSLNGLFYLEKQLNAKGEEVTAAAI